jgi:ABC-type branched-subunit amino acid transport system substrate-binding protein
VKRSQTVVLGVIVALTSVLLTAIRSAGAQDEPLQATEIGVTENTIRIAVIADVDNAVRPGLFQGSVDGMRGFVKYINKQGGLAGRQVELDFIDSKLSADEARNALVQACQENFAIVGTTASFLNNVQPMESCPDKNGTATGLPDVPVLQLETAHQCSPVSYAVIAGQLDCATRNDSPQTYRTRQGHIRYHLRKNGDLTGYWLVPGDLKSSLNSTLPLVEGAKEAGIKAGGEQRVSALATQSDYTPIVQTIKQDNVTYGLSGVDYRSTVQLRKEAMVQAATDVKVWDCTLQCYDRRLIEEGDDAVEGQYVSTFFIPFEEAKLNKSIAAFLKNTGRDKADGFGAQAWAAGLFFRDVVNRLAEKNGNNGITRAAFLQEAATIHDFTAQVGGDDMLGPTDVGAHNISGCFVMMQVKNGKFARVHPKEKGTFDCDRRNLVSVKMNLDLA